MIRIRAKLSSSSLIFVGNCTYSMSLYGCYEFAFIQLRIPARLKGNSYKDATNFIRVWDENAKDELKQNEYRRDLHV